MNLSTRLFPLALICLAACGEDGPNKSDGAQSGGPGPGTALAGEVCPRPLRDAGGDECLACAQQACCGTHPLNDPGLGAQCLSIPQCYEGYFACLRNCFAERIAAGSTRDSWDLVADCREEVCRPGASDGDTLEECIIGYRHSSRYPDEDAGNPTLVPRGIECAPKCFQGWRR